jgi:hypothetical protein
MSRFNCVCGHTIRISGDIPNPGEWLFISDVDYERWSGTIDAEELYHAFRRAYLCPVSGHLWVFEHGITGTPKLYAPAEDTR